MTSLPTITLFNSTYFVDNRLRQLRNTSDPHDFMDFTEFETMVQLATLSIRHSGGAEAHPELTKTLFRQASEYDKATGSTTTVQEQDLFEHLTPRTQSKRKVRELKM